MFTHTHTHTHTQTNIYTDTDANEEALCYRVDLVGELRPVGRHGFTVAAPWREKFHKLRIVECMHTK